MELDVEFMAVSSRWWCNLGDCCVCQVLGHRTEQFENVAHACILASTPTHARSRIHTYTK